jgi:hypothetical protein
LGYFICGSWHYLVWDNYNILFSTSHLLTLSCSAWYLASISLTKKEKYARGFSKVLKTWFLDQDTCMTPHLNFAQGIPGICDDRNIGIIDFSRVKDLLVALEIISSSNHWTREDAILMNRWLTSYRD